MIKKISLIGLGVTASSVALASAIAIPISQSQINSSNAEVPTVPNTNNQPNNQDENNNENNNGNNGESNQSPEIDNSLIKDVQYPKDYIVLKDFTGKTYDSSKSYAFQVYNKTIKTNNDLNTKLKNWFNENKSKDQFNDLHFQNLTNLGGLGGTQEGYNYEPISYVDNSAQIIDSSTNQNNNLKNKNFVYSFQVNLTPASGHAWTDGTSVSKTLTVYGFYSGNVRSD